MRVVLDTNVLISAILFGGLPEELLRRGLEGAFLMVTSDTLLDELEDTLQARFGFPRIRSRLVRQELEAVADLVTVEVVPARWRDPDDDHVLAAAAAGGAHCVVTGDRDLLVLQRHGPIAIITPRALQDALG
jgi:hypothetical protein